MTHDSLNVSHGTIASGGSLFGFGTIATLALCSSLFIKEESTIAIPDTATLCCSLIIQKRICSTSPVAWWVGFAHASRVGVACSFTGAGVMSEAIGPH